MIYMLICRDGGWSKTFEGSEADVIKEAERLSTFHDSIFGVYEAHTGRLVGGTYIPDPIYVFQKD
jgi:hypothetical protein